MKRIYIFILLSIVCNGCNEKTDIESFSTVNNIVDYDIIYSGKNELIMAVRDIAIVEGTIILQSTSDEYSFSFINAEEGKLRARFGRKGNGPNEYIQIGNGIYTLENLLVFNDNAKKEINYVPIRSILENKDNIDIQKEPYSITRDFRPRQFIVMGDKKIAVGAFSEGRFGILDSENNIIPCHFGFPFAYKEIQGIYQGTVFQSKIKSNTKLNRFVIQTLTSDIFEIYEMVDSEIRKVYVSPFNHIPMIIEKPRAGVTHTIDYDNSPAELMRMAVSDELICFTHSSQSYTESTNSGQLSNEILCFDWNGNKVKKYILPVSVSHFCIDEKYIYGVVDSVNGIEIYRFKMN